MIIAYGTKDLTIDITLTCKELLMRDQMIIIPPNDTVRARSFGDPLYGVLKSIFITVNGVTTEYNDNNTVYIDTATNTVSVQSVDVNMINEKIQSMHSQLQLRYGSFCDELPEQKMAVKYLSGNEKVLEIGGNIGRNSLIISSILGKVRQHNLVVLECNMEIYNQLVENRDLNKMAFHIENSALSKRPLIQKGWDTMVADSASSVPDGFTSVNCISYDELMQKYAVPFDTLVLDCEGAFYYILQDMPEILQNVKLIIMENDYTNFSHKEYIDYILRQNKFYIDHVESGGWGPCYPNFFEVWKRL